jgi:hypothetical protein
MWNLGVMSKSRLAQKAFRAISKALSFHKASVYPNMPDIQRICVQTT